jgi:hypothetical protein
MRRLLRPICRLVGHDWNNPVAIRENKAFTLFRSQCNRCHHVITGDWDWMEDNHAWKHYRSSL